MQENTERNHLTETKEVYWQKRIQEWDTSDLSQIKFCEANGLSRSTFLYWRTKFLEKEKPTKSFVQLKMKAREAQMISIMRVRIPNGAVIEVPMDADPAHLKNLLSVLGIVR